MKHAFFPTTLRQVILAATLGLAPSVWATTPADVAWITGVAAVAGPFGVQAVARSSLDVTVEVFRETANIETWDANGRSSVKPGTAPFTLTAPVALKRQLSNLLEDPTRSLSAPAMAAAAASLLTARASLQARADGFATIAANLKAAAAGSPAGPFDHVRTEALSREQAFLELIAGIDRYRATVALALADAVFTTGELDKASNQLLAVRLSAQDTARDFSNLWAGYFSAKANVIFNQLECSTRAQARGSAAFANSEVALKRDRPADETRAQATQRYAWHYTELLRRLTEKNRIFVDEVDPGDTPHDVTVTPQAIAAAKSNLTELLRMIGFQGTKEELFAPDRENEFKLIWDASFVDRLVATALDRTVRATFVGVSNGANFGAIANEVIQGVLAENQFSDRITSEPDRWTIFNKVSSRGSAGNHNAIVYFDNMLTPILKSATFDPSQLLLANAQIYKRAISIVAQVYGPPTAADVASGGADASLNLMNLEARNRSATEAESRKRTELLQTLSIILDKHNEVTALRNSAAPTDWTDYRAAAAASLEKLAASLTIRATLLETP